MCDVNFDGNVGAMEPKGTLDMFGPHYSTGCISNDSSAMVTLNTLPSSNRVIIWS